MANTQNLDFVSGLVAAKSLINKISAVLIIVGIILGIFLTGWGWLLALVAFGFMLVVNSLCIVMPGHAGYLIVLGQLINRSLQPGLRFVIPFISSVNPVDVRLKKHQDTQKMKTNNLRDITLTYVLTYQPDPDYVHLLHTAIGEENYVENALCPWLDAVITQRVAAKSYEDINGKLAELSAEVEAEYLLKLRSQCRNLAGVNLFANMSVAIIDVKFDEEYTKAVSELAKALKEKEIVEAKAEQLKISKTAQAEARRIEADGEAAAVLKLAQAEAEGLKMKGASENEVRNEMGRILKRHPELLKQVLAEHFPKVYGGANPIINLDDMLK